MEALFNNEATIDREKFLRVFSENFLRTYGIRQFVLSDVALRDDDTELIEGSKNEEIVTEEIDESS